MERDVHPRHLLRLGSGERDLRETLADGGAGGGGKVSVVRFLCMIAFTVLELN